MTLKLKLAQIQSELKAPKGQTNNFGNYKYRSCEDILNAVKPLLGDCILTISDDIKEVAGRVYIEATATIELGDDEIAVKALAREPETKKGMDDSQITGATSSYARKYALNGLFCIDDTKDSDTENPKDTQLSTIEDFETAIKKCSVAKGLGALWYKWKEVFKEDSKEYKYLNEVSSTRKSELSGLTVNYPTKEF